VNGREKTWAVGGLYSTLYVLPRTRNLSPPIAHSLSPLAFSLSLRRVADFLEAAGPVIYATAR